MLNSSTNVATDVVDELVSGGWFDENDALTDAASSQFAVLGRRLAPADIAETVMSFATRLGEVLDSATGSDESDSAAAAGVDVDLGGAGGVAVRPDEIVAAVRGAVRCGAPLLGARLASVAWRIASQVADPNWWRELARAGEDAAIEAREPTLLVDLLSHSAVWFAGVRDREAAEHALVRALAVSDEAAAPARSDSILKNLAELYLGWRRFHKALDAYADLAMRRQHDNDPVGTAEAFAGAGTAMLQANQPARAATYLVQADEALTSLGSTSAEPTSIDVSEPT